MERVEHGSSAPAGLLRVQGVATVMSFFRSGTLPLVGGEQPIPLAITSVVWGFHGDPLTSYSKMQSIPSTDFSFGDLSHPQLFGDSV